MNGLTPIGRENRMDGANIKVLRRQLGLTQEEFAHQIGVTFATVNRWENGKSEPSRLAIKMLTFAVATLNHVEGRKSEPSRRATKMLMEPKRAPKRK